MNTTEPILRINDLKTGYGNTAILNNISLTVNKQEIVCIIGEEGSGKSTFLRALTGQLKYGGLVNYRNISFKKILTHQLKNHKIDFISQGGNILIGFTVKEHIDLSLRNKSTAAVNAAWKMIREDFPMIVNLQHQIAGRLSGGERMLLSIACSIAGGAELLILDEPTAGLAPSVCDQLANLILTEKNKNNKTFLILEQNYDFVFLIADAICVLKDSKFGRKHYPEEFGPSFIEEQLFA